MNPIYNSKFAKILSTIIIFLGYNYTMFSSEDKQSDPKLEIWGAITNGFQLSLQLGKHEYRLGDPIIATIFLKNVRKTPATLAAFGPTTDIKISVTYGDGKPVPRTRYGIEVDKSQEITASTPIVIESGKQFGYKIEVHTIFDMTAEGDYLITAKRQVPKESGKGVAEVMSNAVKVKIVP